MFMIIIDGFWSVTFPASNGYHNYMITNEGNIIAVNHNRHQSFFSTSDDEVNFPSSETWFKVNSVIRANTWEYMRLKADDTLEVHHFCSDGCNNHYKPLSSNLPQYSNAGTGRRIGESTILIQNHCLDRYIHIH